MEAASQDDIDKKAAELKEQNPGLSDAQAKMLAKAELDAASEGGGDAAEGAEGAAAADAPKKLPEKGFGEWDKAGGDAFRDWMNDNHEAIAKKQKLDRSSAKSSHENKFIKRVYNLAGPEGQSYGEMWLATVVEANAQIDADAAQAEADKSGTGAIGSPDAFFKQREAQFNLYKEKYPDDPAVAKGVVQKSLKNFWMDGLPLMYVYHVNEFDRGDGNIDDHKATDPKEGRKIPAVAMDVPARRAVGKDAGNFSFTKQDDLMQIAYDPDTKMVYVSSQGTRWFGGEPDVKLYGVGYSKGRLQLKQAGAGEAGAEGAEEVAAAKIEGAKEQWDGAQKKANELYKELYNDFKRYLKTPVKEMNARWNTVESKVMKGLKKCERAGSTYHKALYKQYQIRSTANENLGDQKPGKGAEGYDNDQTPWGSDYTGMWSAYYAFKKAMDFHGAPADSEDAMVNWFDKALSGSDYRKMKEIIQKLYTEWNEM